MGAFETFMWAVIAILLTANLLFTYGVIRRLREHDERLASVGEFGSTLPPAEPAPGTPLPDFAAVTTAGEPVTAATEQVGLRYIGIFTPDCAPCRERLPEFSDFVRQIGRDSAVVVLKGDEDAVRELLPILGDGARVVIDGPHGGVSDALGVGRYPTLLAVRDGIVEVNTPVMGRLPGWPTAPDSSELRGAKGTPSVVS